MFWKVQVRNSLDANIIIPTLNLQNMFLAIIGETYAVVKEDIQSKTADFTIQDFFKTGVNNTKGYLGILDR